jgi:hypothetical protein
VCLVCVFQQTMMLNYFADNFENVETIRTSLGVRNTFWLSGGATLDPRQARIGVNQELSWKTNPFVGQPFFWLVSR